MHSKLYLTMSQFLLDVIFQSFQAFVFRYLKELTGLCIFESGFYFYTFFWSSCRKDLNIISADADCCDICLVLGFGSAFSSVLILVSMSVVVEFLLFVRSRFICAIYWFESQISLFYVISML